MLLVTIHHIVADGWSIGIVTNELAAFTTAMPAAAGTSELSIQAGDYAIWQHECTQPGPRAVGWTSSTGESPLLKCRDSRRAAADL